MSSFNIPLHGSNLQPWHLLELFTIEHNREIKWNFSILGMSRSRLGLIS